MSDVAVQVQHVYKKFRKGETLTSLRDLLPALTGKMFRLPQLSKKDNREFWALQDVSFEVMRGEAFGVIGPNGAGKSTMLKLLTRIMKPTRGSVHVDGRLSSLIELAAGFHPDLTGRENIYLYGAILGMRRREIALKFDQIVDFSGLQEFLDMPVKRYSSGMCARLGFSVAAHVDPEVLLVDEVLSVGDYAFQRKCVKRMQDVIRGGATVLFVSHNLKTVAALCQRCLLLDRGRAVKIGSAQDTIAAYLERNRPEYKDGSSKAVAISSVTLRNALGVCANFTSGERAWMDVELQAHARCANLSVSLFFVDDEYQPVFDTSTERLGYGRFSLEAGDRYACTFEFQMNMVSGIFHPSILIYRYDTQTEFDRWMPAGTVYIASDQDVRGVVHCFPKVVRQEVIRSSLPLARSTEG